MEGADTMAPGAEGKDRVNGNEALLIDGADSTGDDTASGIFGTPETALPRTWAKVGTGRSRKEMSTRSIPIIVLGEGNRRKSPKAHRTGRKAYFGERVQPFSDSSRAKSQRRRTTFESAAPSKVSTVPSSLITRPVG